MTEFEIAMRGPGGEPVDLWRTLTSHGFSELSPMRLDEAARSLELTLRVPRGAPRRVLIVDGQTRRSQKDGQPRRIERDGQPRRSQKAGRAGRARVRILGRPAGAATEAAVVAGVRHVLRLDQDLSGFYATLSEDPHLAWAAIGAGRMIQSPTVFEDVVKTVCTTNCTWSATRRMVDALVTHLGDAAAAGDGPLTNAFPTPAAMAAAPERFYRQTARAGYRGAYLRSLARMVDRGDLDLERLAGLPADELPDDEMEQELLALPGVGPYAAAHIMMTVGRHSRLILDSWSRPAYTRLAGRRTAASDAQISRRFRRYGEFAGLAFWLFVTRDWVD